MTSMAEIRTQREQRRQRNAERDRWGKRKAAKMSSILDHNDLISRLTIHSLPNSCLFFSTESYSVFLCPLCYLCVHAFFRSIRFKCSPVFIRG